MSIQKNKPKKSGWNSLRGLFSLIGASKTLYILSILALAVTVALEMSGFLVIRHVVDKVIIIKKGIKPLAFWAGIFLLASLGRGFFSYLHGKGKARCAETVTRQIRNGLYDHMQRLSFSYHDRSQTGELVQRATSDVDEIRRFFAEQIPAVCQILFQFSINLAILLFLEWRLALLSIIIVPVVGGISSWFFFRIFEAYDSFQDQEGHMTARIQENLSGIRVVRAFARQKWEIEQFREINREQLKRGLKLTWWNSFYWPFGHILCGLQFCLTLLIGGYMAIDGAISPGTFIAFSSLVNSLIWPMQELGRTMAELSKSHVSYQRIRVILDEEQEDLISGNSSDEIHLKGDLEFKKVKFGYTENLPVLQDISFSCPRGSKIALLGTTGSGKTTLVNLLPRFYDYTGGEILLDGEPLKNYSRHMLRRQIGIVEQEPFLFSMTVRENLTYSVDRKVSQEEVEAAAKAASIHHSILSFPEGYDTMVGEKGVSLSGGQKQRIAIARTLLKDPRILILDDSTSAVDADTEARIKKAMNGLMKNRTTFLIAHRIQTLKQADTILVLDKGRIVQQGSHEELIRRDGFYKDVFRLQTRMEEELQEELQAAGAV